MKGYHTNSRTKTRRSAGDTTRPRTSTKICCGSTVKRSGATVGDVTLGYPRGGPNTLTRIGWVGPTKSRRSSLGLLAAQDYRKLQRYRDRMRPSLYNKRYSCNRLGLL